MEEAKALLAEAETLIQQPGKTPAASRKAYAAIDALTKGEAPKPPAEGEVGSAERNLGRDLEAWVINLHTDMCGGT